jgi:hypothetical protein
LKIALCIPCHRQTEAKFTHCLASMIAFTMRARIEFDGKAVIPDIETIMVSCSILPESRNRLVAEAIHCGADYMLWMDADHVFPEDTLVRLLSHNRAVVGCNYARRNTPTSPTASKENADGKMELVWTTQEKAEAGELEEVGHAGLGLCLMDMRAFGVLEQKATEAGKEHFWPLFRLDPTENGIAFTGEDVYFFKCLREAGVPMYVDHGLSWDVGHLHEQILTNAHCVVQKDRWMAERDHAMDKFKNKVDA